jgi:hypothetical protein
MARPSDYSEYIVRKLEDAFRDGASITEACEQAGIVRDTYYHWLKEKDGFQTRMTDAQDWVNEIARAVVAQRITKKKDPETAKWWLERRVKDKFSTRTEQTGKDGKDLPTPTFQVMTIAAKEQLEALYDRSDSSND